MIKITFRNTFDKTYEITTCRENFDKMVDLVLRAFRDVVVIDNETGEVLLQVYFDADIFDAEMWEGEVLNILTWM